MNLIDLFRGHRRSEPTILLVLKLIIMIILVACLTGYLTIVIIDVIQDAPIIRTSYIKSTIRPPSFVIKSRYNFTIAGCLEEYFKLNEPNSTLVDCKSDVTQPDRKYEPTQLYYGTYQPSQQVLFYGNVYNQLDSISISFVINNSSYTNDNKWGYELVVEGSDNDTFVKYIKDKEFYELPFTKVSEDLSDIDSLSTYNLLLNQLYQFEYHRKIEEVIKPSWMNDFGIPPAYESKPHIESTLSAITYNTSSSMPIAIIIIKPKSNTIQIDKEVRARTYLNGMGLIGGAWGLAAAIYTLLFGADTLRPWGIVQMYCCGFPRLTQRKLKKTLPIIPFFDTHIDTEANHDLSMAEKIELIPLLQSRIDSLELFLQEYVVDVYYLNSVRDKLAKSRATLNSMIDANNQYESRV
ncbi:hypothetical protein RhiirA5_412878 [Rhizophagus irregularis]|uniref:Uncharacterized protein n=1 Tax=Rhizophagus irregularis TaxID=588596 RepID=A0A2N0PXQ2_9GLOM|nr:hypothetical protein RhiirA5_412878 [Rhizophagus irregularis]PKC67623.1 hypothetical protein RhiirA1_458169 [Rhizophagus irregularis]CAB4495216.1 unnamed protein product [Rhizophagus irregularis]CAB5382111.1 unnamed protein product [Rhizophagus irregularis]